MQDQSIAFIGCGAMGGALAKAVCKQINPKQVFLTDISPQKAEDLAKELGANVLASPQEAVKTARWLILCTKPQTVTEVLGDLAPILKEEQEKGRDKILCSILAGVTIQSLSSLINLDQQAILRLMPNTPVAIGKGLGFIATNQWLTEKDKTQFLTLFSQIGSLSFLEEDLFDQATVLSSCAPAYVYQFIEYLTDAGVHMGLSKETAQHFVTHAVYGSASMVIESGKTPRQLRDMVTSPGGSTIEGVRVLEEEGVGLAPLLKKAAMASFKRNQELGQ